MFLILEYTTTYKEQPREQQQRRTFSTKEAAIAFAISIEEAGGMAVVTSRYKPSPIPSTTTYYDNKGN